eukprot:6203513-Pleurochrysis_carterae.AAC.4
MTSPRVVKDGNRRKAVALSGGLLAIVASVKIGWELMNKEQSYYDMMDVLPSASLQEIKKGYKTASLRVHPDKLAAAGLEDEGDEAFLALKAAYDVLYDSHLRDLYNKFGPPGIENKNDTNGLLAGLGFFYIVWLAVAYLLTRRKSVAHAQTWSFTGLLALGIFEYQARTRAAPAFSPSEPLDSRPAILSTVVFDNILWHFLLSCFFLLSTPTLHTHLEGSSPLHIFFFLIMFIGPTHFPTQPPRCARNL